MTVVLDGSFEGIDDSSEENRMRFAHRMATTPVRLVRILVGAAMVVWGYTECTTTGYIVGTMGVLPMLGGLYDFCLVALLFHGPVSGYAALHPKSLP